MKSSLNIVLVGFMGAGKSSVAKLLALQTGRPVVATDDLIVAQQGRSITDIFREEGEPHFRKVEKQVVMNFALPQGMIIDCGGGVVLDPENVVNLKAGGILFYLKTTPEEVFRRIKDETQRPLLHTDNPRAKIQELMVARADRYVQAQYTIETTGKSIPQVCQEILAVMAREGRV